MIRRRYLIFIVLAMTAGLLFGAYNSIHVMWRAGHTGLMQSIRPIDLPNYHVDKIFGRTRALIKGSDHVGIPQLNIFMSEHLQRVLTTDLPENTKQWQKGYLVYPDGELRRVKLRHRGDNPVNWLGAKKSWRYKTRKKRLINRTRTFNLIAPQEPDFVTNHLAYWIGNRAGVLSPESRLVELVINGEFQGVFTEVEHLDENFLRKRNIMPVNIYKGEQYNSERLIYVNNYLFDNPYLWCKLSLFNPWPKADRSDLSNFLQLLRNAETDEAAFDALKQVARFEDWARFSAYGTLIQSWHNTNVHNQRIISDPWRGAIQPVVHDTVANFLLIKDKIVIDGSTHALTDLYSRDSEFLLKKYTFLNEFLKAGILDSAVIHLKKQIPGLLSAYHRDILPFELLHLNGNPSHNRNADQLRTLWTTLIANFEKMKTALKATLRQPPDITWSQKSGSIGLVVAGTPPAAKIRLMFNDDAPMPTTLGWDKNGDGALSESEQFLPVTRNGRQLTIDATFLANRVLRCIDCRNANISGGAIVTVATQFNLIGDTPLKVKSVIAVNPLTGVESKAALSDRAGITPGIRNKPVVNAASKTARVWQGVVDIRETTVIHEPVVIKAGTVIRVAPFKSLIFKAKVLVEGTKDAPVKVRQRDARLPWGVVALQGHGANGSRINNFDVRGGSGGVVNHIFYTGMLSVHDADDIRFKGLSLSKNSKYDDMMHVVYGDKIVIDGCHIKGALSDAIDIDISNIQVRRCNIFNSGNDAIDFMSSTAIVKNSQFTNSKDKGISVGEDSKVFVYNSIMNKNQIGLESKDNSRVLVTNSAFLGNKKQLNAYKKNWRYGGGGTIRVDKSLFAGVENKVLADKHSKINLNDSDIPVPVPSPEKNIFTDVPTNTVRGIASGSEVYNPEIQNFLDQEGLAGNPKQRGPIQ